MTARLLISNCVSVHACVFSLDERTVDLCHPPEWIRGSTVELWWTENKHNQSVRTELRHISQTLVLLQSQMALLIVVVDIC